LDWIRTALRSWDLSLATLPREGSGRNADLARVLERWVQDQHDYFKRARVRVTKKHANAQVAQTEADKLIREKKSKGYVVYSPDAVTPIKTSAEPATNTVRAKKKAPKKKAPKKKAPKKKA
jgi:hypothetical protein